MRAKEFTINVPITISINGDDDPIVSAAGQEPEQDGSELQQNPVMVTPLQQELELKKAQLGKDSPVIDKITQDTETIGEEPPEQNDIIERLKALLSK